MSNSIESFIKDVDSVTREVKARKGVQLRSATTKQRLHNIATRYFADLFPQFIPTDDDSVARLSSCVSEFHLMTRGNPSRQKCLDKLKQTRTLLVSIEAKTLSRGLASSARLGSVMDNLIIDSLLDLCETAARSYRQATEDLAVENRHSYRGVAADLREALREVLDNLAPDKLVEEGPGFKLEGDAKHPTMKQKMRFVLRSREAGSSEFTTSDASIKGIEAAVGDVFRSVYTRSSVSTHTVTSRLEVLRILGWVRLMMCELLEIPIL